MPPLARLFQVLFVISKPEVYKGASDTFIIFGEAKIEDLSGNRQVAAAQNFAEQQAPPTSAIPEPVAVADEAEDNDATGINEDDINLVIQQTQVSRGRAIATLKKNNGDVVNSIMALSS